MKPLQTVLVVVPWILAFVFSGCAAPKPIVDSQREYRPNIERTTNGYHADLREFEYPFDVSEYVVQAQGKTLSMAYMDLRPEVKPKGTFVLLHGKNFSGAYFRSLAVLLYKKGYRVVMPDQIGFGKSSKPEGYSFVFQEMALQTKALLDFLEVKDAYFLGHSMGGMLGVRFALMYPDSVKKLFLVNPLGLEDPRALVPYRSITQLRADEERASPESIRKYQSENYYGGKWSPAYEEWIQPQIGLLNGQDFLLMATISALTTEMIFTQPVLYELKSLKVPTVLLIGTRDRTSIGKAWVKPDVAAKLGDYRKLGREAVKEIKGSRLIEIEGLGHVPFVENFAKFWEYFSPQVP